MAPTCPLVNQGITTHLNVVAFHGILNRLNNCILKNPTSGCELKCSKLCICFWWNAALNQRRHGAVNRKYSNIFYVNVQNNWLRKRGKNEHPKKWVRKWVSRSVIAAWFLTSHVLTNNTSFFHIISPKTLYNSLTFICIYFINVFEIQVPIWSAQPWTPMV